MVFNLKNWVECWVCLCKNEYWLDFYWFIYLNQCNVFAACANCLYIWAEERYWSAGAFCKSTNYDYSFSDHLFAISLHSSCSVTLSSSFSFCFWNSDIYNPQPTGYCLPLYVSSGNWRCWLAFRISKQKRNFTSIYHSLTFSLLRNRIIFLLALCFVFSFRFAFLGVSAFRFSRLFYA